MLVTPKNTVNKNSMKNKIFLKTKQWQSSKLKNSIEQKMGYPKNLRLHSEFFINMLLAWLK